MSPAFPENVLILEASTAAASVALICNGEVAAAREVAMGASRDDALLPAVASVLEETGLKAPQIDAVCSGSGPGSFTSLRIAASLAKGLAVATGASLYAIPSMLLAAAELRDSPGHYLLHGDALRGERYAQFFDVDGAGRTFESGTLQRMSLGDVEALARGAAVTVSLVTVGALTVSANDLRSVQPHARNVAALGHLWHTFGPVSVESWEPAYGRLAEAQVKWESAHGRVLPLG